MDIYVDESGDLDKHYPGNKGPRYFSLSFVITDDSSVTANIANHLIKKYGLKDELKHHQASNKIKKKFVKKYSEAGSQCFLKSLCLVVDTQKRPEAHEFDGKIDPAYFYYTFLTSMVGPLLEREEIKDPVNLYMDHRWNKSQRREKLNESVKQVAKNRLGDSYSIDCHHVDSRKEKNIQVADMIAGFSRLYIDDMAHNCFEELVDGSVEIYKVDVGKVKQ